MMWWSDATFLCCLYCHLTIPSLLETCAAEADSWYPRGKYTVSSHNFHHGTPMMAHPQLPDRTFAVSQGPAGKNHARGILYYSTPREEPFTILLPERNPLLLSAVCNLRYSIPYTLHCITPRGIMFYSVRYTTWHLPDVAKQLWPSLICVITLTSLNVEGNLN